MNATELLDIVKSGESSKVQFKREFDNQEKIAAEMIAMSNAKGGMIVFGVEDKTGNIRVDEMIVPGTDEADINKDKVTDYLKLLIKNSDESESIPNDTVLYQNLNIIKKSNLTLGGLLFFAKDPQRFTPAFHVKAVAFYGNCLGGLHYRDSRDIVGVIPEIFRESMLFFKQNLRHEQKGQNFNSVGILEISEIALEELIRNALIHRDYSNKEPIQLRVFDNRVEIISPGYLPNGLTVEKIKLGNMVIRNNILASYAVRLIKFRGFGTGIIRALKEQPNIELTNDVEGEQFIVKIPREQV